jgi:hypothetical protein
MRTHGLGTRLGLGTDIYEFFADCPCGPATRYQTVIERENFVSSGAAFTGGPGGTQEVSCKPGQSGILAQKFWAREKFNGEFFFGTLIQNPKKNSVKY